VLRLYGIPIAPNDARALVAALIAYATPDAEAAAERISGGLEQGGNGLVALEPAHRDAILMCLDDASALDPASSVQAVRPQSPAPSPPQVSFAKTWLEGREP
jgi:hypothetical protein